jgi:hypothetical protein
MNRRRATETRVQRWSIADIKTLRESVEYFKISRESCGKKLLSQYVVNYLE